MHGCRILAAYTCGRTVLQEGCENLVRFPILSLFSGAGGLDLGFARAGFEIRLAIDISDAAVKTYRRNHPDTRVEQLDLLEVTPEELLALWDECASEAPLGIVGGPPCQAFSVSNVHQREDDPRRLLVDRYAEIIATFAREKGIAFFVFENVPGLLTGRHKARFEAFRHACEKAGFRIYAKVVDAANFGLAQYRRRIIVVGIHERVGGDGFDIPEGDRKPLTVRDVIGHLPEPWYYRPGLDPSKNPVHPNHWTQQPKSPKFTTKGALVPGTRLGRSFRVLQWDAPSWTVAYGHREVHVHPNCHRRLSVYEAMLLQGFPPDYVLEGTLSQQITLVSDAVPPPMGEAIARALSSWLARNSRDSMPAVASAGM